MSKHAAGPHKTGIEVGRLLTSHMAEMDDCELAGVVATGLGVLTRRKAWTMSGPNVSALVRLRTMLVLIIERRQA